MRRTDIECFFCSTKTHLNAFEAIHSGWSFGYHKDGKEYWRCPVCTQVWVVAKGNVSKAQQDTYGT